MRGVGAQETLSLSKDIDVLCCFYFQSVYTDSQINTKVAHPSYEHMYAH
jgi:hypothetical protein